MGKVDGKVLSENLSNGSFCDVVRESEVCSVNLTKTLENVNRQFTTVESDKNTKFYGT